MTHLSPLLLRTAPPPVMEARRWLDGSTFPPDRPLLNLSQAAPSDPPPAPLRAEMARIVSDEAAAHLYGPVLGLPELRASIAVDWSGHYGGVVRPEQVAVTSGCNQAFAGVMATLVSPGDNVVLPTPFYFNHKMWLDMAGVEARLLETDAALQPDPETAAGVIDERTRAIVLVTPNNPCGVEYDPALMRGFRDLARSRGIALVVDETYRDFHARKGAPHDLLSDPDWDGVLIQLYSFSKAYRLTGHRVGAVLASPARLAELEKWLDTVAICPPQLGQRAALWGMENLRDWLARERREVLARRAAIEDGFEGLSDWVLEGCGAYFAYVRHPFDHGSDAVARSLVDRASLLLLPGTMFGPRREDGGSGRAERTLRVAFANVDRGGIAALFDRLRAVTAEGL